jgi:hypothetical protein
VVIAALRQSDVGVATVLAWIWSDINTVQLIFNVSGGSYFVSPQSLYSEPAPLRYFVCPAGERLISAGSNKERAFECVKTRATASQPA